MDIAPAALREWAFVLDPALLLVGGDAPPTHGELLAAVNTTVWRSPAVGAGAAGSPGERVAVAHSVTVRLPPLRPARKQDSGPPLGAIARLEAAVIVRLSEPPQPASRYTLSVAGADCSYGGGLLSPAAGGRTFTAVVETLPPATAAASAQAVRPRLSRPSRALPTWEQTWAGVVRRSIDGCAVSALGFVPRWGVLDTPCPFPTVAFDSWTVRGRVHLPAVAAPWLPALAWDWDSPGLRDGSPASLGSGNLSAGARWLDVELFAPCTDLAGLVLFSWRNEGGAEARGAVSAGLRSLRGLLGAPPGWHYLSLRALGAGDAAATAATAELVVPLQRRGGRSFASTELSCRSGWLHAGPALAAAWGMRSDRGSGGGSGGGGGPWLLMPLFGALPPGGVVVALALAALCGCQAARACRVRGGPGARGAAGGTCVVAAGGPPRKRDVTPP